MYWTIALSIMMRTSGKLWRVTVVSQKQLFHFTSYFLLGGKLVFLPPYSPDYNPIEQAFHSMKAWLRHHEKEALEPEQRTILIEQALQAISAEDASGWIINCGYS